MLGLKWTPRCVAVLGFVMLVSTGFVACNDEDSDDADAAGSDTALGDGSASGGLCPDGSDGYMRIAVDGEVFELNANGSGSGRSTAGEMTTGFQMVHVTDDFVTIVASVVVGEFLTETGNYAPATVTVSFGDFGWAGDDGTLEIESATWETPGLEWIVDFVVHGSVLAERFDTATGDGGVFSQLELTLCQSFFGE